MNILDIKTNFSLQQLNTFKINVNAKFFIEIHDLSQLDYFFKNKEKNLPFMVLGGGSNVLFTKDYNGYILKMCLKGIHILENNSDSMLISASAGENWDDFVNFTVLNNLWGIENLSFIPGEVGASPIQNIGAYGVEVKDTIYKVVAYNTLTTSFETFDNTACDFGYRNSIFKSTLKQTHIVTELIFKLSKIPQAHITYGDIKTQLSTNGINEPKLEDIRNTIGFIRNSKLPDTEILPNAGSFFKNPVVNKAHYEQLLKTYPNMPSYSLDHYTVKIPAAWLIDSCKWKGKRLGDAGVHINQALVLVNHGTATGNDIIILAHQIKESVFNTFGIEIEFEVNII